MSQLDTLPEEMQRVLISGGQVWLAAFKVVSLENKIHIEPKEHLVEPWYTAALDEIGGYFVEELKPHVPCTYGRKTEIPDGCLVGAVVFCTEMADDGQMSIVAEFVLPPALMKPKIMAAFSQIGDRGRWRLSAAKGNAVFEALVEATP